jgi:hypothetical protein
MPAASRMRSAPWLTWLPLLVGVFLACASAPLVNPSPIATASTPARTRAGILRGIVRSHWTIVSEKPGEVVARLDRGAWAIDVAIDYGTQVSARYVSSHGLDYDDSSGTPKIDSGYNRRVRNLMSVIGEEIALQDIPGS